MTRLDNRSDTRKSEAVLSYGGSFCTDSGVLSCRYNEGFFANCTVALWNITEVARKFGNYPTRLDFSDAFAHYCHSTLGGNNTVDLYPVLFQTDQTGISQLTSPPESNLDQHGIYQNIDFDYYAALVDAYFKPSSQVSAIADRFVAKYGIDLDKTLVVWYRGTDKRSEVWIASPQAYIREAEQILAAYPELRVWIQSEDQSVRDLFQRRFGERCIVIDEFPPSEVGGDVHNLPPSESGIDRQEHGQALLALVTMAARARFMICHTGNISLWLMLFRGHSRSVIQFDRHGIPLGLGEFEKYWRKLRHRLFSVFSRIPSRLPA